MQAAAGLVIVWAATAAVVSAGNATQCREGLILPIWMPQENMSLGDIIARGLVYFICMFYMFVGVSIIADRFMASIEVITSKEKEIVVKKPNGETQTISVRIWNETVSNLTLMALGSSAPEILLSIIEVYAQNFNAGELGPGTIVGSAAFNMFIIIAICVSAVPSNENRKIKHLRVFFVTMTWSVFAYIWLYLILSWSSYGVIEIWEGLLTLFFFPATVVTAYIADRRLLIYKYLSKSYRMNKRRIVVGTEGDDVEMGAKTNHIPDGGFKVFEEEGNDEMREFEEHRREYIQLIRDLRKKHPNRSMEEIEMMAREELINRGPKSRAFYRIQATRKLMGGGNLMKKKLEKLEPKKEVQVKEEKDDTIRICFDPAHYTVMENVGQFAVTIVREGDLNCAVCVDYATEDGTANAGGDYEAVEGTLVFRPGETQKQIFITVIDDEVFEEDEHFYVRLSNARYLTGPDSGPRAMNGSPGQRPPIQLATPSIATVMILDDDHGGIFNIAESEYDVPESIGELQIKVNRYSGARGRVVIPIKTRSGTAKEDKDYEPLDGMLVFENNETFKDVPIHIVDNESYEKECSFFVELGEPHLESESAPVTPDENCLESSATGTSGSQTDIHKEKEEEVNEEELTEDEKIALLGKPKLGEQYKCEIKIRESKEFKNTVDKLFQKANVSLMVGTSSWKEQFIEAITVSAGDDDDEEGGDGEEGEEEREPEEKMPTCTDYVLHFLTLFWKLLFAFVPPTDILDGWVCFVVSIIMIGVLTAVIGDLASHFGCTIGLKDSVTAVAFVALGTSVPDTFASKVAAINDKYADSSIGNVTGSNAVNVFLGIGIAWSIAAVYHTVKGDTFRVAPGNLAFSVTLFCCCAVIACAILMARRSKAVGGELGGPTRFKVPTTIVLVSLWLFYVLMSSMEAYDFIKGF